METKLLRVFVEKDQIRYLCFEAVVTVELDSEFATLPVLVVRVVEVISQTETTNSVAVGGLILCRPSELSDCAKTLAA